VRGSEAGWQDDPIEILGRTCGNESLVIEATSSPRLRRSVTRSLIDLLCGALVALWLTNLTSKGYTATTLSSFGVLERILQRKRDGHRYFGPSASVHQINIELMRRNGFACCSF
jgi:hypothetical protein